MKKTDLAMIILVASVSVLIAFFIANSLPFLKVSDSGEKVKTIEPISAETTEPDPRVFYKGAINPTIETIIGGN